MSPISTRRQELEAKIAGLEVELEGLRGQLRQEMEMEQHNAIDHLEDYMTSADHKLADLRNFFVMTLAELRVLFSGGPTKDTGHFKL